MSDRLALVTGSTSGIGLAVAGSLAADGCRICLHGLGDPDELARTRDEFEREHGVETLLDTTNLTDVPATEAMMRRLSDEHGGVDVLVNNAGVQHVAPLEEFPAGRWDLIIAVNLSSAFHTTRLALPSMRSKNRGRIVNLASAHGLVASPYKSAYVAAKHGLVGLTKVTALETARTPITCNAVCPGWVETPLVREQIDERAAKSGRSFDEERHDLLAEKHPSAEFVSTGQIGSMIVWLASDAAAEVRGAALSIDGGWTAQ